MKLLFKFMSFVSLNRFYFNRGEAEIPQRKTENEKKPTRRETKKPSKMLGFSFGIDDLSVC